MPIFYFSLHDHIFETDDEGVDLPDRAAARIEAIRYAGEVLRDEPHLLDGANTMSVRVGDSSQREAFRLEITALDAAS